jgi:WD40 repeat protein
MWWYCSDLLKYGAIYIQRIRSVCIVRVLNDSTSGNGADNVERLLETGSYVVSAAHDTTLRIWEVSTGKCRGVMRGHMGVSFPQCSNLYLL